MLSQHMNNQKTKISKRETEESTDKHYISRIAGKLKTVLLNSSLSVQRLKEIYTSLTYQNLKAWSSPYQNYYFSGKNEIISQDWFEKWNLDMFKNIALLDDILARDTTINFDRNEEIKTQINKLVQSLIQNESSKDERQIIDEISRENFKNACREAKEKNYKIIFLGNHASHFDTPILSYILDKMIQETHEEDPEIPTRQIRFIWGAYMYYNKGVRNFTAAFDTTLVFGPKDLQEIKSYLSQEWRKDIIIKFHREALKKLQENNDKEITMLFPYAGRAENKNWCKDELPIGISQYIEKDNCLYIPLWFTWSDNIFPTGDIYEITQNIDVFQHIKSIIKYLKISQLIKFLHPKAEREELFKLIEKREPIDIILRILENMDIFKLLQFLEKYKFKFFKPSDVYMTIGEHFVWWEKKIEEINEIMHKVANDAIDKNQEK